MMIKQLPDNEQNYFQISTLLYSVYFINGRITFRQIEADF